MVAVNLSQTTGIPSVGTGNRPGSYGTVDAGDFEGDSGAALQALIDALLPHGGGDIDILPGAHSFRTVPRIYGGRWAIRLSPSAVVTLDAQGATAAFELTNVLGGRLEGGRLVRAKAVNDQAAVRITNSFNFVVDGLAEQLSASGVTTNPTIGVLVQECVGVTIRDSVCLPSTGHIGYSFIGGVANSHQNCRYTTETNQTFPQPITIRDGWVGLYVERSVMFRSSNFVTYGIGFYASDLFGGERPKAMIHLTGGAGAAEGGHISIDNYQSENCASQQGILVEGVYGWVNINNAQIGYSAQGAFKYGEAGIKVTKHPTTDQRTIRVQIQGGNVHNYGRAQAGALAPLGVALGAVLAAQACSVAASDNSYNKTSGSWTTTPLPGYWINCGSGFTAAANDGWHKVVSATSNKIIVATAAQGGVDLVDEASATRTIAQQATGWDAAAVWVDNCSTVVVGGGFTIFDQRHQWGFVIDTTTVRGVSIDDVTCHRSSGNGVLAPFRIPHGALLASAADPELDSGLAIGIVRLQGWGATPTPFSDGVVSTSLGVTATNPASITGGVVLLGRLSDTGDNLAVVDSGTAIEALSLVRRL
jgi:hypothetical protein